MVGSSIVSGIADDFAPLPVDDVATSDGARGIAPTGGGTVAVAGVISNSLNNDCNSFGSINEALPLVAARANSATICAAYCSVNRTSGCP